MLSIGFILASKAEDWDMNEEGGRGERLGEKKRVGEPGKD